MEDHGDGEKALSRGKTNSKKEDKRDAASIALLEKDEARDGRERQANMLELEEAKQTKMLEIEATNAKTKAKGVALASMKTNLEVMKVDLKTVLPRKRLWFEKMQAEMLKLDQL
ncbi:Protein UXT-like protein [Hordeum vulgare]|nr:Protein UXT-like protein [Hordeum vulgare]